MQTCEKRVSQIHRLVENELGPVETSQLNEHLTGCATCSAQMTEFVQIKALIEESLSVELVLPPVEEFADGCAARIKHRYWPKKVKAGFFKRALIVAAACLAAILLTGYLSGRIYFRRTFSYQLTGMVVRCSDGIEKKSPEGKWEKLRVGDRLRKETVLRTPERVESFVSFDGIKLLTDEGARFEVKGKRALAIQSGELVIASTEKKGPLIIRLGDVSFKSAGGVFRVARAEGKSSVGIIDGSAELELLDGKRRALSGNQTAVLEDGAHEFEFASLDLHNPFAMRKISVIDRIKQRFAKVISKYVPNYQFARRANLRFGGMGMLSEWTRPEAMFQFASYGGGASWNYVQANVNAMNEYYESLFVPSNRSIAIGRQRGVFLNPNCAASFPAWSHDGSMIAFIEHEQWSNIARVRVARIDDMDNPWVVSQQYETVLPFFPIAWAPDDRHVLFLVTDDYDPGWGWRGPYKIKIAPIDPAQGPLRDFNSPFTDIPLKLPVPIGKTISPGVLKLPWGDGMLCANWGNLAYIPLEQDGQSVSNAPGVFLTNFNPREVFVLGGGFSPSGSMIHFTAFENLNLNPFNAYILYDVEDILDGFTQPPRTINDPRIKKVAPTANPQFASGFSFDESLVILDEDVNNGFRTEFPTSLFGADFDLFYANALPGQPGKPTQIHLPGNQMFLTLSPEGNRLAYCSVDQQAGQFALNVVSLEIEADMDNDLGGVLIDNSGTNLIVPPGALQRNFKVKISTPFTVGEEAEIPEGESRFFSMRLLDAEGLENPKFIEPMTLTIRYTDDEVAGLEEGMLEIYYYDDTDPARPKWVPLGGTVDPEHNEITVEIRHFSKFSVGPKNRAKPGGETQ